MTSIPTTESPTQSIPIDEIEFVKELYPRLREDDAAIERYRDALEKLPPITVARGRVLVDGFHRWQAHRRENSTEILAVDLGNLTDIEIVKESIRCNAVHGQQLSREDKQRVAGKLWNNHPDLKNADRVRELAELLSVSERAVQEWTKDARAEEKQQQQAQAWDAWLDCKSYREIAEEMGMSKSDVERTVSQMRESAELGQPPASRQHFDVWSFGSADDAGTESYFGRMPGQIVENLLWLYTEPGQIVVDPFAGGGTTIDVAKRMGRRVWASDRKPSTPMLPIHEHDILAGWPAEAPQKADFILLDPPYWQQAAGRYSDDATDMANMSLEAFMDSWRSVVATCREHLTGLLAFVVSPTQLEDGTVVDHAFEMYQACRDVGLEPERRIIATYNTQQATGQQVEWARENKRLLKLYRDVVVLK